MGALGGLGVLWTLGVLWALIPAGSLLVVLVVEALLHYRPGEGLAAYLYLHFGAQLGVS